MLKTTLFRTLTVAAFVFAFSTFTFAQETEQKPADRPLKITYNPHGQYTSEARSKMISGWIQLRVTFLDTGKIGDIFYVNESSAEKELSKNGLLKSSYEAAKQIEFLPAIKDGKAIIVTKVLIYEFAIGDRTEFRVGRRP